MGILTVADRQALALTASALAQHERAAAVITERGSTYETRTEAGAVLFRERAEVRIAGDSWRRAMRGLLEFGLSPASRGRVDVKAQDDSDPASKYFTD
jgi:P27 family predicted phage terminase small subunit